MGILKWMGLDADLAKPIEAIGNLYTTDKARLEAEKNYQEALQKPMIAQSEVNKTLAASQFFFTTSWQPLLGYTCGFLILLYYGPQIVIYTYLWWKSCIELEIIQPFPMAPDDLLNLIYLLFGFGTHSLAQQIISRTRK